MDPRTTLEKNINALALAEDYLGLGNLFVEVLMKPHQENQPDADALLLEATAPALLRQRFRIPDTISYASVFRDRHIAAIDRGSWPRDRFLDLVIIAYVFGSSRENLPAPHDKLLKYYRETAKAQREVLEQIQKNCPPRPVQQRVRNLLQADLSPEELEREMLNLLSAGAAEKHKYRTVDPD